MSGADCRGSPWVAFSRQVQVVSWLQVPGLGVSLGLEQESIVKCPLFQITSLLRTGWLFLTSLFTNTEFAKKEVAEVIRSPWKVCAR